MKKMILAIAAMIITTAATAQETTKSQRGDQRKLNKNELIQHRTDMTVKKYGLNAKQAEQLLELNQKYGDKIGGPRRGGGPRGERFGNRPERRPNMSEGQRPQPTEEQKAQFEAQRKEREAAVNAYNAELEKILTPEQFKAYQADAEKQRPDRGPRGGQRGKREKKD